MKKFFVVLSLASLLFLAACDTSGGQDTNTTDQTNTNQTA